MNSDDESMSMFNSAIRCGSNGGISESGHPQGKFTRSLCKKSMKCWLILVGGSFLRTLN